MPNPNVCAILGAAGLSGGVSHTLSTAILLVELTQESSLIFPLVLATVTSTGVSRLLGPSIFDCLMKVRRLPFLPPLSLTQYVIKAQDIMKPTPFLTYASTKADIVSAVELLEVVEKRKDHYDGLEIPLLESEESKLLVGQLHISQLRRIIRDSTKTEQDIPILLKEAALLCSTPFYFPPDLTFEHAHSCFTTMSLTKAYVINNVKLLGVVTRGQLLHGLAEPKPQTRARANTRLPIIVPETPVLANEIAQQFLDDVDEDDEDEYGNGGGEEEQKTEEYLHLSV